VTVAAATACRRHQYRRRIGSWRHRRQYLISGGGAVAAAKMAMKTMAKASRKRKAKAIGGESIIALKAKTLK